LSVEKEQDVYSRTKDLKTHKKKGGGKSAGSDAAATPNGSGTLIAKERKSASWAAIEGEGVGRRACTNLAEVRRETGKGKVFDDKRKRDGRRRRGGESSAGQVAQHTEKNRDTKRTFLFKQGSQVSGDKNERGEWNAPAV